MALRALTLSRCAPRPLPHSLTRSLSRSHFSTQPEPIRLRNSLSGGSQTLAFPSDSSDSSDPSDSSDSSTSGRSLSWYACGPTVYDSSHIGHARTYINTDIIRRVLTDHFKIHVNFAMGMTDIDNKIINRAKEECGSGSGECVSGDVEEVPGWLRLARKYEASFLADMDALHVRRPGAILRVTEHLDEIKDYIATIMAAGKAYETSSGVYFSVPRHSSANGKYGKLGNIPSSGSTSPLPAIEEAVNSALEDQDIGVDEETVGSPSDKQDPRDFALWKRVDAEHATAEGEPYWDSPWGPGRPGWHIECSAVTHSHFGTSLDVHSGGIDLRFPHHTNEIAQCEAHNCCDHWVSHWIHTGHLYIDGLKMSKSLKNFISIEDYLSGRWRASSPSSLNTTVLRRDAADDLRLFFLQHKYHSSLHFSTDRIDEARQWRIKVNNTLDLIQEIVSDDERRSSVVGNTCRKKRLNAGGFRLAEQLRLCQADVDSALRDDFDTPRALNSLSGLCSGANVYAAEVLDDSSVSVAPLPAVHQYVVSTLEMFGLSFLDSLRLSPFPIESLEKEEMTGKKDVVLSEGLVDELVSLRFKVRQASVQQLADIKGLKKSLKSTEVGVDTATAALYDKVIAKYMKSSQEVLSVCDDSRDVLKEDFGIRISDTKDRSFWKKIS